MQSFAEFMKTREQAATAYTKGDAGPVNALTTEKSPATFFGPDGTKTEGSGPMKESFSGGAAQFGGKGRSRLEILQQAEGGDIAYWSGIQHAEVDMKGETRPMSLRICVSFVSALVAVNDISRTANQLDDLRSR